MTLQVTPQVSKVVEEADTPKLLTTFIGSSFVVSGLSASDGGGLTLNISSGSALINGYLVEESGASLTLTDNATNHVYLKLTRNAQGKVNGATYEVNTTGTQPADSIKICEATTSNGAITGITDKRSWALYITRGIIPTVDNSSLLGSSSKKWKDIYIGNVIYIGDGGLYLSEDPNLKTLLITTPYGYVRIGPANTAWTHFHTDRPAFWFEKKISVQGNVEPYNDNAHYLGSGTKRWIALLLKQYLEIKHPSTSTWIYIDSGDGVNKYDSGIFLRNNGVNRFSIYKTMSDDLVIARYSDTGSYIESVLTVVRQTGELKLRTTLPMISNQYNLGSSSLKWRDGYFAGNLYVDGGIKGEAERQSLVHGLIMGG